MDLRTRPLQHAGELTHKIDYHHAKVRAWEKCIEQDSAPVGGRRNTKRYNSDGGAHIGENCTQQQQKPVSRKQPRTHHDRATPEEPYDEPRKRRRRRAEKCTLVPSSPGNLSVDQQHPIAYWAANKWWPRQYFDGGKDMENILARKISFSSRSRKTSDTDSAKPGSTNQGKQKSREQNVQEAPDWCKKLLEQQQMYPQDTPFRDDLFKYPRESVRDKNES
ncbi:hypothetical protein LTR91_023413 [Friedmanniomyces endolithicus]|uniref:Uncharacterized protein n=1 Tax=Friedmanniomyces endolithicus TaxID=329885 RepID=A0AAN6H3D7_9PEZI|nr:hypothetical protein LTR57_023166 [Friedmanniomyces endolithicus]KAK0954233.1 hypothetical protein LTR91_023413 [Friedmanniomyces endolithicus]KAK0954318.1 hypothetical protein LTS01_023966 [Friedmanniomyces endolithicus]